MLTGQDWAGRKMKSKNTVELTDCLKCGRMNSTRDEHCKECGIFLAPKILTPRGWIPSLEGERTLITVVGGFRDLSSSLFVSLIRYILGHRFVYFLTTKRVIVAGKKTRDYGLSTIQIPDIVKVSVAYNFKILTLLLGSSCLGYGWYWIGGVSNYLDGLASVSALIFGLFLAAEGVWSIFKFRVFTVSIYTAAGPETFSVSRILGTELEVAANKLEGLVAQDKSSP